MIEKLNDFNIKTDNEKIVYYNFGKYIIFDLITLNYVVVDKVKYDELLEDYRDYLMNKPNISVNETEINRKNKEQFLDVMFITSFDCNYSCIYCYQKEYKNIKSKMNTDDFDKIKEFYQIYDDLFDTNSIIRTIGVMGGEPFLDDNFEFIESIFENFPKAQIAFTTNGSNISKYKSLIKRNKGRIKSVVLSVDGDKKTHLKYRTTFDNKFYDNIWDTLEFLLNNDIKVTINSVYHPEENNSYPSFFDILEKYGWLENKFSVKFDLDLMKTQSNEKGDIYLNVVKKSFKKLIELDDRANYIGQNFINYTETEMLGMIKLRDSLIPYKHCGITLKPSYTFLPTGNVVSCLGSSDPRLIMGTYKPRVSINKENIERIYNRDVRNMPQCQECKYKYFCKAGCIVENFKKNDNLDNGYCSRWKEEDYTKSLENVFDYLIAEEIKNAEKY